MIFWVGRLEIEKLDQKLFKTHNNEVNISSLKKKKIRQGINRWKWKFGKVWIGSKQHRRKYDRTTAIDFSIFATKAFCVSRLISHEEFRLSKFLYKFRLPFYRSIFINRPLSFLWNYFSFLKYSLYRNIQIYNFR